MSKLNTAADPRHAVPNPMDGGLFRTIPLAAVILSFAVVSFYYGELPDQIPVHFGASGKADGFGHKMSLWALPVINLGMFYLLGITTKTSFKYFNYPVDITEANAARQHRIALQMIAVLRLVCCLLIAYLVYAIVRAAQTGSSALSLVAMGLFLVGIFGSIIYYYREAKLAA
ncbi:MAG: DUF1648 domain-containing protein [Bacteroidota bacterium]